MSSTDQQQAAWHVLTSDEAFSRLTSTPGGLSGEEAARRLVLHGANELRETVGVSPWHLLLEQFKNILIIILLAATVLSAFMGHAVEAVTIAVIVVFAVLLGFIQEFRAERAIQALRRMAAPLATVLRDGLETEIPARELVPGDVILLKAGDRVPADVRLTESVNLKIDEAVLTGESVAVEKQTAPLTNREAPLGDRRNLAFCRDRRDVRPRPGGGRRPPACRPSSARSPNCWRRWKPAGRLCRRTWTGWAASWRTPRLPSSR